MNNMEEVRNEDVVDTTTNENVKSEARGDELGAIEEIAREENKEAEEKSEKENVESD